MIQAAQRSLIRQDENINAYDYTNEEFGLEEVQAMSEIHANELKARLQMIVKQQTEFESRIQTILEKMEIQNPKEIAKLMTGN